jgi:hypothetical protein
VGAAVGGLEQADQVARLGAVEGDRVGAAPAGLDLLLVPGEQELERVGQRRGSRGRVIRIVGVELPLAGDPLGRRAVRREARPGREFREVASATLSSILSWSQGRGGEAFTREGMILVHAGPKAHPRKDGNWSVGTIEPDSTAPRRPLLQRISRLPAAARRWHTQR